MSGKISKEIMEKLVQLHNADLTEWLETEKAILDYYRQRKGNTGEILNHEYEALARKIEQEIERQKNL